MGQLGDGTTGDATNSRATPVTVVGVTDATDLDAGGAHACASLSSGAIKCWGADESGQLGDNSSGDENHVRLAPVSVFDISNATQVTAGAASTCALLDTGRIRCWGTNEFGELGSGYVSDASLIPLTVANITDAVQVAAGLNHTCARLDDGQVSCWGGSDRGQIGNGTIGQWEAHGYAILQPTAVPGITDAIDVSAVSQHTCAALASGGVSCWGYDEYGQVGDGTTGDASHNRLSPVAVVGVSGATGIETGIINSCALVANGQVACWGGDWQGQLGDGTTGDANGLRLTPVYVQA